MGHPLLGNATILPVCQQHTEIVGGTVMLHEGIREAYTACARPNESICWNNKEVKEGEEARGS
jgi:hypothetical protein